MTGYSERQPRRLRPNLSTTLELLKSGDNGSPGSDIFYGISGLTQSDMKQFAPVWSALTPAYRRKIMRAMIEISETDFEMDYRAVGMFALTDPDPVVREAAIEVLWEDESLELLSQLIAIATKDEIREVRAGAASALGRFVLLGELGDLPQDETRQVQNTVIALLNDPKEDTAVRRRALESIANSSHETVPESIRKAYYGDDPQMRISSVFAMGRSCDDQWSAAVLEEIESEDPEMRYEAARASGELELQEAVPLLSRLAAEDEREIQEVSVWALGEIGGREALRVLNSLAEIAEDDGDDELLDAIHEAIGNASLVMGDIDLSFDEDGFYDD